MCNYRLLLYNFCTTEVVVHKKKSSKNAIYPDSEALKMINYDAKKCILEATFKNDRSYQYFDVSKKVWNNFLHVIRTGNSAGAFINQHIKPFYECVELPD